MLSNVYFTVALILEITLLVLCFIPKFRCFSLQTIIFYSCVGLSAILYIVAANHFIDDFYQKLNCMSIGVVVLCMTILLCVIETVHFFIMLKSGHATEVLKISSAGKNKTDFSDISEKTSFPESEKASENFGKKSLLSDPVKLHNLCIMIYFLTIVIAVICMVTDFFL